MERYANNRLTVALCRAMLRDQMKKLPPPIKPDARIPSEPQQVDLPPIERFIEAKE
jgi:hypothetical protein